MHLPALFRPRLQAEKFRHPFRHHNHQRLPSRKNIADQQVGRGDSIDLQMAMMDAKIAEAIQQNIAKTRNLVLEMHELVQILAVGTRTRTVQRVSPAVQSRGEIKGRGCFQGLKLVLCGLFGRPLKVRALRAAGLEVDAA